MPILRKIGKLILDPFELRNAAIRIIARYKLLSYEDRLKLGAVDFPPYGYIVYNPARLADKLGYQRISILEFGVAGGSGYMAIPQKAATTWSISC